MLEIAYGQEREAEESKEERKEGGGKPVGIVVYFDCKSFVILKLKSID